MTMGPEPIRRILRRSVRFGIAGPLSVVRCPSSLMVWGGRQDSKAGTPGPAARPAGGAAIPSWRAVPPLDSAGLPAITTFLQRRERGRAALAERPDRHAGRHD